jgi:4-oxalocrotonate tautomerase
MKGVGGMPFIQIYMVEGRTIQQKREMSKVITEEVARIAQVKEHQVKIYFIDMKPENVVTGGKLKIDE